MAKNLKLNIKNTQIAQAINLGNLKNTLKKKEEETLPEKAATPKVEAVPPKVVKGTKTPVTAEEPVEVQPRTKARSRSAFADPHAAPHHVEVEETPQPQEEPAEAVIEQVDEPVFSPQVETPAKVEVAQPENRDSEETRTQTEPTQPMKIQQATPKVAPRPAHTEPFRPQQAKLPPAKAPPAKLPPLKPKAEPMISSTLLAKKEHLFLKDLPVREKFGPTGKHVNDLIPKRPVTPPPAPRSTRLDSQPPRPRPPASNAPATTTTSTDAAKPKNAKFKEFKDIKPAKKTTGAAPRSFDSRDSRGLGSGDDDSRWRKRKQKQTRYDEDTTIRPTSLTVRVPISIKDLAVEMKLKASQIVQKLFMKGVIVTLNDLLEDETTIQMIGIDFGCTITIDTSEEERIRITDKTILQEIADGSPETNVIRAPIVAFMGHVDHGKTSLIDYIRKTNRASGEAGQITQHIGAFMCSTDVGNIAILDTPGHEAFSAMRERGANVTDIIVLVVAGDEGIRMQTIEAIQHAKAAEVSIVVAINKSDKPNFNPETVYRQLSEQDLLPESWGGQTITVNCSAITGEGIKELLEMLALQAEVLELKANPNARARGTVIESELHKGLGSKATVLVQNGTLKRGDAIVFDQFWGKVKTMHDEYGHDLEFAGPSQPVEITGLSGLPEAGQEFIVVKNDKEAKDISQKRAEGIKQNAMLIKKKLTMESMLESSKDSSKKTLNLIIRADVQGSLEALKTALQKIKSTKADLNIISSEVGEVSESDVQLAGASKAVILGFHTAIESHAESLVKEMAVVVKLHDIIYHAVDDVKAQMKDLLDKIPQENEKGKALVKATFKSSHLGTIAGCQVTEGIIHRNNLIRVMRGNTMVFRGTIASLKKVKEDVREVPKGIECGILINNFNDAEENDIIEAYEITYLTQEL